VKHLKKVNKPKENQPKKQAKKQTKKDETEAKTCPWMDG